MVFSVVVFILIAEMPTMLSVPTILHMPGDRPSSPTMPSTADTAATTNDNDSTQMSSQQTPDEQQSSTSTHAAGSPTPAISTNPTMQEKPSTSTDGAQYPSTMSTGQTVMISIEPDRSDTKPPIPTMITTTSTSMTTNRDRPVSTYGGPMNTDPYFNEVKPPSHPYDGIGKPHDFSYPYPPHYHDKYHVYQDIYPLYSYQTSNEPPISMSNYLHYDNVDKYAPAISYTPTIDYYGTTMTMNGGANGGGSTLANRPMATGATYMGNGWSNMGDTNRQKVPGSGGNPYGEGNYHGTDWSVTPTVPYIRTYFNPDDNLTKRQCEYFDQFRLFHHATLIFLNHFH